MSYIRRRDETVPRRGKKLRPASRGGLSGRELATFWNSRVVLLEFVEDMNERGRLQ